MDGDNHEVASVVHESAAQVLKKGAEKPNVEVNKTTDKIVLDFKTKMNEEAKNKKNYKVYENDKLIGDLKDFVEEGTWVDSTTKKAVEFKLKKNQDPGLLAGKTYKIKVDEDEVETDDGKALSSSQKTITFKTPSISDAQPVAKIARVTEADSNSGKIVVTFDKDLADDAYFNAKQFTVKKPGGNTVSVDSVTRTGDAEIVLEIGEEMDRDLTYTVDIPANGVNNAYFANASNKETKGLKAQAQKDIEIKSMSAKFEQDASNKDKADLYLTFDQRPDVESITKVVIKEGTNKWTLNLSSGDVKLHAGDSTGKTVVIEDVTKFDDFKVKSDKDYTIEILADGVKVDAGDNAKKNQEKLKATTKGVSVNAPEVDTVRLLSANEIEIEFKENINTSNLDESDVKVKGYESFKNGNFTTEPIMLQGDSQIKVSSSGKKMTIKTADKDVKFVTSFEDLEFEIAADTFKNSVSNLENNEEIKFTDLNLEKGDKVDRAKPVMVGAEKVSSNEITITYTEAVEYKGSDESKQASQFSVDKASKAAYGKNTSTSDNKVRVVFNENDTFKSDLDLAKVQVKYTKNTNVLLRDLEGNEADGSTLTGIKSDGSSIGGGSTGGGSTSFEQAWNKYTAAKEKAEKVESKYVAKVLEENDKKKADSAQSELDKATEAINEAVKAFNDLKAAEKVVADLAKKDSLTADEVENANEALSTINKTKAEADKDAATAANVKAVEQLVEEANDAKMNKQH